MTNSEQKTSMRIDEKMALVVHINGVPFLLQGPATLISHPANFELAGLGKRNPDDGTGLQI